MGKGKKGGRRPGGRTDPRISSVDMQSDKLETFYKAQKIVPEDEWDQMLEAFRKPLPTTFRLTGNRASAEPLSKLIGNTYVPYLTGIVHDGKDIPPPRALSWYPNQWAWQISADKGVVRKNESFRKFQDFLVYETEAGNISRQEAVSMIPPLMLEVRPGHKVLDMCAAPGSKTVQLLEAVNDAAATSFSSTKDDGGLLVANDSDAKRCYMLVHQSLNRMPSINMMVTNHDASRMPTLRLPKSAETSAERGAAAPTEPLLFDRILADVPCSGDGTLRKNPNIWKEWKTGNGLGLHSLQLRILERGLDLLRPGGRLVYSTCSLNPMENEAVISATLAKNSSLLLVDVSTRLPGLKRNSGLTAWVVFDKEGKEVAAVDAEEKGLASTLWPNGREAELGLERCCRILPHHQDTGGFFVAVLEKKGDPSPAPSTDSSAVDERPAKRVKTDLAVQQNGSSQRAGEVGKSQTADVAPIEGPVAAFKEDPYTYISEDNTEMQVCRDFFELSPDFDSSCLLVRNAAGQAIRTVYYTSATVRQIIDKNSYKRMRLISCGTKVFIRQDPSKDGTYRCKWRIAAEGLSSVRPFLGPKRVTRTDVPTFRQLMGSISVPLDALEDATFKNRLLEIEPGSAVLDVTVPATDTMSEQKLCVPIWRGPKAVNVMIEKLEKRAMSLRIFGEDITPHTKPTRDTKKTQPSESQVQEPAVDEESVTAAVAEEVEGQAL